jgi:dihydroneopterin aldolase
VSERSERTNVIGDRIELKGLRAVGIHGALPEEQVRAQPFEIDLELHVDLRAAGQSDDLADTVDYGALAESIERIVTRERFQLLERLAERIADEVRHDQRIDAVAVTVRKLRPPVAVDLASAAVTIIRP